MSVSGKLRRNGDCLGGSGSGKNSGHCVLEVRGGRGQIVIKAARAPIGRDGDLTTGRNKLSNEQWLAPAKSRKSAGEVQRSSRLALLKHRKCLAHPRCVQWLLSNGKRKVRIDGEL